MKITWRDGQETVHSHNELLPAPKQKASSQDSSTLAVAACKWAACSSEDNLKLWLHLALATLYQVYVSQSAAHSDLRLVATPADCSASEGLVRVYAQRDFKTRTLVLLPFSSNVVGSDQSRPKDSLPLIMTVYPDKEEPTSITFWMKMKATPKHFLTDQSRATVVVPFWALATKPRNTWSEASSQENQEEIAASLQTLVYKTSRVLVPTPVAVAKGVRVQKAKIVLKVMSLTNAEPVTKGTRLVVNAKPDNNLPSDDEEEAREES